MKEQKPNKLPKELFQPSEEFMQASEKLGLHWWHWDNVKRELLISPSLMKILGYTPEEFDPSVPTIAKNIHPDDVKENLVRIRKLLYGNEDRYEMEYRIKASDGKEQWYYNRGAFLRAQRPALRGPLGRSCLRIPHRPGYSGWPGTGGDGVE